MHHMNIEFSRETESLGRNGLYRIVGVRISEGPMNVDIEAMSQVVGRLRELAREPSTANHKQAGLCGQYVGPDETRMWFVFEEASGDYDELHDFFPDWDEFSGDLEYPVADPLGFHSPSGIYSYCDNKWDPDTEYGQSRIRLASWLADKIENKYLKGGTDE